MPWNFFGFFTANEICIYIHVCVCGHVKTLTLLSWTYLTCDIFWAYVITWDDISFVNDNVFECAIGVLYLTILFNVYEYLHLSHNGMT
jgi:hypothetical protein